MSNVRESCVVIVHAFIRLYYPHFLRYDGGRGLVTCYPDFSFVYVMGLNMGWIVCITFVLAVCTIPTAKIHWGRPLLEVRRGELVRCYPDFFFFLKQ